MTRHKTLQCVHEPFGDAYYFGPERLAERYENSPEARKESGYSDSTYRTIFDGIAKENSEVRAHCSHFFPDPTFVSRSIPYDQPCVSYMICSHSRRDLMACTSTIDVFPAMSLDSALDRGRRRFVQPS
jgi:hypothetical protein